MGVGTKNLHLKKHKKLPQTLTEVRRGILRNTGSPSPAPNFKIAGKVKMPLFRLPRAFPAAAPGLETAGGSRLSGKQAPVPTLAPPERAKGPRAGLGPSPTTPSPPAVSPRGGGPPRWVCVPLLHWTSPALTPYELCKPAAPRRPSPTPPFLPKVSSAWVQPTHP